MLNNSSVVETLDIILPREKSFYKIKTSIKVINDRILTIGIYIFQDESIDSGSYNVSDVSTAIK